MPVGPEKSKRMLLSSLIDTDKLVYLEEKNKKIKASIKFSRYIKKVGENVASHSNGNNGWLKHSARRPYASNWQPSLPLVNNFEW